MSQNWLLLILASSSFDICRFYMNAILKESGRIMYMYISKEVNFLLELGLRLRGQKANSLHLKMVIPDVYCSHRAEQNYMLEPRIKINHTRAT